MISVEFFVNSTRRLLLSISSIPRLCVLTVQALLREVATREQGKEKEPQSNLCVARFSSQSGKKRHQRLAEPPALSIICLFKHRSSSILVNSIIESILHTSNSHSTASATAPKSLEPLLKRNNPATSSLFFSSLSRAESARTRSVRALKDT